jgi:DNA phosphorothioation-dependent restriction protein DptH
MPPRITESQRKSVLELLAQGFDRETIAARVGVTLGQVSAVAAHVKMGTYGKHQGSDVVVEFTRPAGRERVHELIEQIGAANRQSQTGSSFNGILIGVDAETNEEVFWNPDAANGAANPHILILGESGFGKTYATCCILTELALQQTLSIVFDYGQGFEIASSPRQFVEYTKPIEIRASLEGVAINPLQLFPSDVHGPVNVAQRVADTFQRVYPQIGVQQHAVLRQAVLDVMIDEGIIPESRTSWNSSPPPFASLQRKLHTYAENPSYPQRRIASSVASHISTMFVFNTFQDNGLSLDWQAMLESGGHVFVIQLKGLEHSLERAVTEFLLWNLIGFIESVGPGFRRCFVILDEAHKLALVPGSPAEKLLREGRKFGLGLILASQQPEDFSSVAFANTATKMVFQIGDDKSVVSRRLARKVVNSHSLAEISELITRLPRGWAYFISENVGRVVRIHSFEERMARWHQRFAL